jgi:hypothetical protein
MYVELVGRSSAHSAANAPYQMHWNLWVMSAGFQPRFLHNQCISELALIYGLQITFEAILMSTKFDLSWIPCTGSSIQVRWSKSNFIASSPRSFHHLITYCAGLCMCWFGTGPSNVHLSNKESIVLHTVHIYMKSSCCFPYLLASSSIISRSL